MICIRRALYEDIPGIMEFMDKHWKPGNILARNRNFFEWQFLDGDKVNMFLGIDDECGKIYGMIGFIRYNQNESPDISACTWQTIKSSNPILGIQISEYMSEQLRPRYACSAGLSEKSVRINELLGWTPTSMDHYYRLADKDEYKIADISRKMIPEVEDTGYCIEPIYCVEEMKEIITEEDLINSVLSKNYEYIQKRYFKHPIYHYDIWKILDENRIPTSVLITRDEVWEGSVICKIIDYYGETCYLGKITAALDRLMEKRNYEFVDVYSYGIPKELYESAGFLVCDEESENIIPNYFHPFVRKNITLRMIDPKTSELRMFRGDGDQDRPC